MTNSEFRLSRTAELTQAKFFAEFFGIKTEKGVKLVLIKKRGNFLNFKFLLR